MQSSQAPARSPYFSMYENTARNTLCYQGYQETYNTQEKKFGWPISCAGHWGDPYIGCARIRNGIGRRFSDRVRVTTVLA